MLRPVGSGMIAMWGDDTEVDDTHVTDMFSVAEDSEVVELHAQEQGDFVDSGDAAKVQALQAEIAEMKRSLTEKWLCALQKEKERLQQQLQQGDYDDDDDNDIVTFKGKRSKGEGDGKKKSGHSKIKNRGVNGRV